MSLVINSKIEHQHIDSLPCACKTFCKDKTSIDDFATQVLLRRGLVIRQPEANEVDMAAFLVDRSFSHRYLPFRFEPKNKMEELIRNKGTMETDEYIFKLFIMRHQSQKDSNPAAALLLKIPKKPVKEYDHTLDIDFLGVRNDFQKKYLSTLLLSYAVKVAESHNLPSLRLWSSSEGLYPYIRFGFASKQVTIEDWKKYSEPERIKILESNGIYKLLLLRFNRPDVKGAMREQLFRALIEHPQNNNIS